jgi:hypothetical protein
LTQVGTERMTPPDNQQIGDEAAFLDDDEASPKERTGSIGNELRASGPAAQRRPTTRRSRQGLSRSKPPGAPVRCGGHRDRRDDRWSDRTLG